MRKTNNDRLDPEFSNVLSQTEIIKQIHLNKHGMGFTKEIKSTELMIPYIRAGSKTIYLTIQIVYFTNYYTFKTELGIKFEIKKCKQEIFVFLCKPLG